MTTYWWGVLAGMGAVVGVELIGLWLLVVRVDWERVVREAERDLMDEWAASPRGREHHPDPAWDYEHG